ncbi:Uncharacterised protein [[Flavobacterium] thermophilum]|nr:Uncharacterised protein [[Flavobacterium] thermophilum]
MMKQYLGDHNYRASSFVFRDEESYYDFKVGNVVFPSDFDTYENMNGEVITYRIEDLKENK